MRPIEADRYRAGADAEGRKHKRRVRRWARLLCLLDRPFKPGDDSNVVIAGGKARSAVFAMSALG